MRIRILAAAGCLLVLIGAGVVGWHYARPRLPTVAAVDHLTDASIVAVVGAAGDQAAVTVTDLVATTDCEHTMFAHGHIYTRTANLYTAAGSEDALIGRIAAGLPTTFGPSRANPLGSPVAPLTAQPGAGVRVTVQVISAGWISATAETDCRAGTPPSPPRASATSTVPAAVATVFAELGAQAASWHTESVPCAVAGSAGSGGSDGAAGGSAASAAITTIDAVSTSIDSSDLAKRLAGVPPPTAVRFATGGNRVAWRDASTSTIVSASDDGTHVTAQITTDTC